MKIKATLTDILYSALILIALVSFFGAAVYRIYSLNAIGVSASLILAAAAFIFVEYLKRAENLKNARFNRGFCEKQINEKAENNRLFDLLTVSYLIAAAACFAVLWKSRTDEAIISPWQAVPSYYFALYAAATVIILYLALKSRNRRQEKTALFLISVHYFLSFSAALIVYKIGYGFDPFIHRATAELIDKTGFVSPKPFYYLGQYSLVVIIHKISGITIEILDKLLVPFLAAVFLPLSAFKIFSKLFEDKRVYLPLILAILALPFPYLIATTPQNLAYLFLIFALLSGLSCSSIYETAVTFIFSLAALLTQPIAGIPALLFALSAAAYRSNSDKIKKYFYYPIFFAAAAALPSAFYFYEKPAFGAGSLKNLAVSLPRIIIPGQEKLILNFIYLYGFNIGFVFAMLIIAGIIIFWRHKKECGAFGIYLLMASALLTSYFISKALPFDYLINYERGSYSGRILTVSVFFTFPFIASAAYFLLSRAINKPKIISIPIYVFLAASITASLYLSYPRFDRYFNSRGYSTSQSDIKAADWIEENGSGDYIVLADQQVSAAALNHFGFKKYYESRADKSPIFYYPIPTGGPLYNFYLDMVYKKPARETIEKAMTLAGVNQAYFVLNEYWHAFPKLIEEAKLEADSWKFIDEGKIYIFKYKLK